MTIYSLDVLLSWFGTNLLFHVRFCCFLTCIQVSQEAGQVVWYSHLFKNFPQFVVMNTVQGFSIVNEAEVDVFLESSCFFYDPMDDGNLISGSSVFSKSSLNIWKFSVHLLLKPSLENFECYFASVWDECDCVIVWTVFGFALLYYLNIMKTIYDKPTVNIIMAKNWKIFKIRNKTGMSTLSFLLLSNYNNM